jgi:hypothetical protein
MNSLVREKMLEAIVEEEGVEGRMVLLVLLPWLPV